MGKLNKELIDKIFTQGELAFFWNAYRKDGSVFSQFELIKESKLKENLFTDVDQHPENYKIFELVSIKNPDIKFSVDLETGDFKLKDVLVKNNIKVSDQQLKCTFWRRKAITVNLKTSDESAKYLHYVLGWHTNIEGSNIKKEYIIFPDYSVQEVYHKQSRKIYARGRIVKG